MNPIQARYSGAPHTYSIGDRVWVDIPSGSYNGVTYPRVENFLTITKLFRTRNMDMPGYHGVTGKGSRHVFTEASVSNPPEPLPPTLADESGNIADYLSFDAIDNPLVKKWVQLLREYDNG